MKRTFLAIALFSCTFLFAAPPSVTEKVARTFNETFPNAEKVTWYDNENSYEVLFTNNQVSCRLWYDGNGNVTRTERYYGEDGLSPFVKAKLNKKYAGKKVFGVTEVVSDTGTVYYIILEDAARWYHVTGDAAGNLYLEKKMNKA